MDTKRLSRRASCAVPRWLQALSAPRSSGEERPTFPCGAVAQALLAALLSVVAPSACEASDVAFTVEGRIRYETANPPGHVVLQENFTMAVSNSLWSITTFADGADPTVHRQVYDGSIVTAATLCSKAMAHPANPPRDWLGNDSVVGVEVDDTPNPLTCTPGPLWLAYASASKLGNGTNGLLELAWFVTPELRAGRFKTPASWQMAPSLPFLPSRVDYFIDWGSYGTARGGSAAAPRRGFVPDTVWASYRATAFTNIDGLLLPLTFDLKGYEPADGVLRKESLLVDDVHGTLLGGHRGVADHSFDHSFGEKTLVEDKRYSAWSNPVPLFHYVVTNRTLLPVGDPQMLKAYARAYLSVRQLKSRPNRFFAWRRVAFVTICVAALLPFAFMLGRRGGSKRAYTALIKTASCRESVDIAE